MVLFPTQSVKTEKAGFEKGTFSQKNIFERFLQKLKHTNVCGSVDLLYLEAADYIYASIPDLPKNFRPSALRSTAHADTDDEEKRKGTAY